MKHPLSNDSSARGATLIEAVIAIGVLAVAIPLVYGALAEGGKSGLSSQAETRSTWMIPACIDEIHASRQGRSLYFSATAIGCRGTRRETDPLYRIDECRGRCR
jgi:Tfp pilus assembly protein PilV